MAREPVDIDPEVLKDPVDDNEEGGTPKSPDSNETGLVPAAGRSLASPDPFYRYMAEIRRYPTLTREEEVRLAREYRETGDRGALFRLVTSNLMMVARIALSFRRAARNLLDLIQEGNLGLLQAIERFDPELGVRLPTYAAWWVRAYMVKFLLDNVRMVRVGTTNARRKLLRNLHREKQRLERKGFDVGPKLLAEHFGVSEEDVRDVEAALAGRDVSIDAPADADEQGPDRSQFLPDAGPGVDESVERRQLQERAEQAISEFRQGLNERDTRILDQRLLSDEPLTLQELGDEFGTSREAVRQAEVRLKKRLGEFLKEHLGDLGQVRLG